MSPDGLATGGWIWQDRLLMGLARLISAAIAILFLAIVFDLLRRGTAGLSWSFLTEAPRSAGRAGGIGPILVSTLCILGVTLAALLPLGLAAAIALAEWLPTRSVFARVGRVSLDILAGMPSMVFGLFGNAFFAVRLGMGLSILSGGLTLACMALPLFVRAAEDALRAVPNAYRLAGEALGMRRTRTLSRILLPSALPGIGAAVALAIGRALAETAALIFTSGYATRFPSSPFDSGRTLSVHIYDLAMNVTGGDSNAYASALVLVGLLLAVNATAAGLLHHGLYRRLVSR